MEPGTRLENYEIRDKLGEGGMGAVYRAEDIRLKRDVAVKVLPPEVAADAERLARLEREAQLLASLNHPNVATVHGFGTTAVEEAGASRHVAFLVMELVEGESLYDRVAAGPLPWREAVRIASGIAAGLDAAHERGIVHRDLKPANVHLAADGTVKVLDFGLAKAYDGDGASGSLELSASPTVAAATRTGIILGTAAYMSPEQARGKAVDKRADIWALGCVLYEMLAGHKAFEGETVSDVLAAILKEQPDLEALPPLPPRLSVLLERLLQKDPKLRLRDVGDARLELDASLTEKARTPAVGATGLPVRTAAIAAAVVLAAGLGAGWVLRGAPEPPPQRHVILANDSIAGGTDGLAISPDGTMIAEFGFSQGIRVRSTDDLGWRSLEDTAGNTGLTFDASGDRIYFGRNPEVLSVAADGGTPVVEATFPEGTLVYALFRGLDGQIQASTWAGSSRLYRIPPGGGAEQIWEGPSTPAHRIVVTTQLTDRRWFGWAGLIDGSGGLVVIDPEAPDDPEPFLAGYRSPLHVGAGEVLAVDERGRLTALMVDTDTGSVTSQPVVRVEGLAIVGNSPAYDLDEKGTLTYVAGTVSTGGETLTWFDRDGDAEPASQRTGTHDVDSRLSPDGRTVALEIGATESSPITVWTHDLERDVRTALTPGIRATFPVWSPDGREIALMLREGADPPGIYVVPADRSGPPRLLLEGGEERFDLPMDWSPDGSRLLYITSGNQVRTRQANNDLWLLPLDGGEPEPFLDTDASEVDGRFSPDGRWIAYRSDQSGQYEIYMRPAAGGGETRISADGGSDPEWNPAGGELFFLQGRRLMSVTIGDDGAVGAETELFERPGFARNGFSIPDVSGERFLLSFFGTSAESNTVHAIFNWRRGPVR